VQRQSGMLFHRCRRGCWGRRECVEGEVGDVASRLLLLFLDAD
jgi:hypothetical protein